MKSEDIHLILGALDTLGTSLADHNHQWTEGEKEIYNQAIEILRNLQTEQ